MKAIRFITYLLACFMLLGSNRLMETACADEKKEGLLFAFADYWNPMSSIFREIPGKMQMIMTFRNGENFDNHIRSLTRLNIARDSSVSDPVEAAYKMRKEEVELEFKPLHNIEWVIINKSANSLTYSMRAWDNPPFSDRTVLCRILVGKYNIFIISYMAKDATISPDERQEWLKSLDDARIIER